jgi:flagellar hook-associated protein 3 FlgL
MYYDNLFSDSNSKLSKELFDVNKQISSGLKIQYAQDDVRTFTETMRLDNEITTIQQSIKSVESASKVTNQTDSVLNEFTTSLDRTKTLLIQAANGSQSDASLDAIAEELRGLEDHFKNLSNTSINGKYLFSGSAVDVKPIDENGIYHGNAGELTALSGDKISQQYNLSGAELFLGEEKYVKREVTTNVVNKNLFDDSVLSSSDSIRDLMGDKNGISPNTSYFYVRGTKSDGTAFKEKFSYSDTDSIDDLLNDIGKAYGNTSSTDVVNVSMNSSGQIVVQDKMKGSSKLDFHMVGAIDYAAGGLADVTDIDELETNGGETNYPPASNLFVKEFVKSGLTSASGATNIEGAVYDRAEFSKDGSFVTGSMPQVLKEDNSFATPSTKLSEVADTSSGSLDGTSMILRGKTIDGNSYDIKIDLNSTANGGSEFSLDTDGDGVYDNGTYSIFNMSNPRTAVDADEMTYQQLMDVINMTVTGTMPAANSADDYDDAIRDASYKGTTTLTYDGKLQFNDAGHGTSKATIALYDENSDNFTPDVSGNYNSSAMTFNTNNAITIRDPKTDFFATLDEVIKSVENHKLYPDSESGDIRNVGIENAIAMMDDLQNHIGRSHSKVGAQSNALSNSLERNQTLEISTMSLRSSVIDTDLAEASLELTQLQLNYEAMLSTVGKVSQLSLVNYL